MTGKEKFEILTTAEMLDRMGFYVKYNEGTLPEFLSWLQKFGAFFGIFGVTLVPFKKTPENLKDWEEDRTTYTGISLPLPVLTSRGLEFLETLGPKYFYGDAVFVQNANRYSEDNFVELIFEDPETFLK
jgi:hypothetical protein